MFNTVIVVVIVLVFVYFIVFPDRVPGIFKRSPKTDSQAEDHLEEEEHRDGQCKPSSKLIKARNELIIAINKA